MSHLLEMKSSDSCPAAEAWAEAPTQPSPKRLDPGQVNDATTPKTVPQGGVKDCCD